MLHAIFCLLRCTLHDAQALEGLSMLQLPREHAAHERVAALASSARCRATIDSRALPPLFLVVRAAFCLCGSNVLLHYGTLRYQE